MITDKQRQKDNEYDGEYLTPGRYKAEQWVNILPSSQITEEERNLIQFIYSSYNHAANSLQIKYHLNISEEDLVDRLNALGRKLAEANGFEAEIDTFGEEYWWYLCFWGKNLTDSPAFEWKLQPELADAAGTVWPELEQTYYAFMNDVDRSMQIRYSEEDSVWIAAAALLYEKYYSNPGISADDILLMQYEVQTRTQKVFGQDVDVRVITRTCNADERGNRYNYLRDIYKYYRVTFPGEYEGEVEQPDPEEMDLTAYIYCLLGYMKLADLYDFIAHEYAHLVDESYAELNESNGFVRIADFLSRQQGKVYDKNNSSDAMADLRSAGTDCTETFHMIGDALIREYPNFVFGTKCTWYDPLTGIVVRSFCDTLHIADYVHTGACIAIRTVMDGDDANLEVSLNLPDCGNEEVMLDIEDKCSMLPLMTSASFRVETVSAESYDYKAGVLKYKASVLYPYSDLKEMSEEHIIDHLGTAIQIFASYYTDICQNYYPAQVSEEEDPLAAALGSKLKYRPARDAKQPNIIYKAPADSPTADYVANALYGISPAPEPASTSSEEEADISSDISQEKGYEPAAPASSALYSNNYAIVNGVVPTARVEVAKHPDRSDQSFRIYPKNLLIQGAPKTGKYHEAILNAVGIIEGKGQGELALEPVPDILEHFASYVEEGRILQIACPDIYNDGFDRLIEHKEHGVVTDGVFKDFANRCGEGRYVVMMEEADLNWLHLFGEAAVLLRENRREGAGSFTAVTLPYSKEQFRLPSNLYVIGTCDTLVSEDTILQAVNLDFHIIPVEADPSVLRGTRIDGIRMDRVMESMNQRISYFLGKEYQLGEGFFMTGSDSSAMTALADSFRNQIIPVLEKWFDGNIEQIRYVLGDNAKRRQDSVFFRETPYNNHIFKGRMPDSFDKERCIYEINEKAFSNPRSYIEIYE